MATIRAVLPEGWVMRQRFGSDNTYTKIVDEAHRLVARVKRDSSDGPYLALPTIASTAPTLHRYYSR